MKIIHDQPQVGVDLKTLKPGQVFIYPESANYGEAEYGMVTRYTLHIEFVPPPGTIPVVTLTTGEIRFWAHDAKVIPLNAELKVD